MMSSARSSALLSLTVATVAVIAFSCQSVLAQDGKGSIRLPLPGVPGSQVEPIAQVAPGFKLPPAGVFTPLPTQTGSPYTESLEKYQEALQAFRATQFVVKDGGAYLSLQIPGGLIPIPTENSAKLIYIPTDIRTWTVPIAGGGESGCWSVGPSGQVIKVVAGPGETVRQK